MITLTVDLDERSYPIFIGESVLDENLVSKHVSSKDVIIISNTTVAKLYLESCKKAFSNHVVSHFILEDGEEFKNLESVNAIFTFLLENNISRDVTLVALGGGVVGDITGFVAASYQRGVKFVQIPTTLLSQVDSSVGGKTGVNHELGKNMIGAFHQPQAVFIQLSFLTTLPDREYFSGLAEVVKYGLINDEQLYQYISGNIADIVARSVPSLEKLVYESCKNKSEIVAQDEKESGVRALLNLGHTFGHAIETMQQYKGLLHGEAVAIGMLMAADLSASMRLINDKEVAGLKALLVSLCLPVSAPSGLDALTMRKCMNLDKKNTSGSLRLVLMKTLNKSYIESDVDEVLLMATINKFIST